LHLNTQLLVFGHLKIHSTNSNRNSVDFWPSATHCCYWRL